MEKNEKQIWFPARKYGWGWSAPCAWQGWVVMAVFVILLCTAGARLLPGRHFILWIASFMGLSATLILICLVKGEKPRWRSGKD